MGFAALASRIIVGAGGPALAGDVTLVAGNNSRLDADTVGKRVIVSNPTPGIPRSIELFNPGVATAITLARFAVPQAVLTRLDVNAKTAPGAGTTAANCWSVNVAGSSSGAAALALATVGTGDYHLGIGDMSTPNGTNLGSGGGAAANQGGYAKLLQASAAISVAGMDMGFVAQPTGVLVGDYLMGLCAGDQTGVVANDLATFQAAGTDATKLPWLRDANNNPAFGRFSSTGVIGGGWQPVIFSGAVALAQNQRFYIVLVPIVMPTSSVFGDSDGLSVDSGGASVFALNIVSGGGNLLVAGNGTGWNVSGQPSRNSKVRLFGTLNGLVIGGTTIVSLTHTGAGDTAPADINVSVEV